MAGLAGTVGSKASRRTVETMLAVLAHRGQDETTILQSDSLAVGCCLTRGIDRSNQPISQGGKKFFIDGIAFPRGTAPENAPDSVPAMEEWIPHQILDCQTPEDFLRLVDGLDGAFALVCVDEARKTLLLARDCIGHKPLHYSLVDGTLIFASESKALLAGGVKKEIDQEAIAEYFLEGVVFAPRTPFLGIKSLVSGGVLSLGDGELRVLRSGFPRIEPRRTDPASAVSTINAMSRDAILRYIASLRGRKGIMAVGGVDSWYMAAMMEKVLAEMGETAPDTVTVQFRSDGTCDLAGGLAATGGKRLVANTGPQGFVDHLPESIWYAESLGLDCYPSKMICYRMAARETGAGYLFTADPLDVLFGSFPAWSLYVEQKAWEIRSSFGRLPSFLRMLGQRPWTVVGRKTCLKSIIKGLLNSDLYGDLDSLSNTAFADIPIGIFSERWANRIRARRRGRTGRPPSEIPRRHPARTSPRSYSVSCPRCRRTSCPPRP